jgi:peptidoglycan/LPS O-acetylase OafA/YrhL
LHSKLNHGPPSSDGDRPERRITALDGWRGISILLVIVGHLVDSRYLRRPPTSRTFLFAEALSTSGVLIFFTISGFIITTLALSERLRSGRFSAHRFYLRRIFRIVPPFFLYLTVVLLLANQGYIAQDHRQTLTAAAFVCNLSGMECGWFAGHSWSLAYEEQFYLLFPLLFLIPDRFRKASVGCLFVALATYPVWRYELHGGPRWWAVQHATFNLSFLCAGVLLALHATAVRRLCTGRYVLYATGGAVLIYLCYPFLDSVSHDPQTWGRLIQARALLVPVFLPVSIAWLLGYSVWVSNSATRLLETAWLRFFGMISYSLYLWQQLFCAEPQDYLVKSILLFPPLMLVCAVLSYYLVEQPFVRLGRYLVGPRAQRGALSRPASLPQKVRGPRSS